MVQNSTVAVPRPGSRPLVIGVIICGVVLALVLGIFLVMTADDGGVKLTTDVINSMAARDPKAASLVDDALLGTATQMGVVGLPASVTLKVEPLKVVAEKVGDVKTVTATYTLTATGRDGVVGQQDQTFSASVMKTSEGDRLSGVTIAPPLAFDAASYFGTGASGDAAQLVATDLRAGNTWLPGTAVALEPSDAPISLAVEQVADPDQLDSYSTELRPAVDGVETTWTVQVTAGNQPVMSVEAAKAVTKTAVAHQVKVGTLTADQASAGAIEVAKAFDAAISAGQPVTALLTPGSPPLTDSGLAAMKDQLPTIDTASLGDVPDPLTIKAGDFVLIRSGGKWLVDGTHSSLVTSFLAGSGTHGYTQVKAFLDFSGCTGKATIKVTFLGVATYSTGSSRAMFQFVSSGDVKCDHSPSLGAVTATWPGNRDGAPMDPIQGTDPGKTVVRGVAMPAGFSTDNLPLTIQIGDIGGATATWTFTAKGS